MTTLLGQWEIDTSDTPALDAAMYDGVKATYFVQLKQDGRVLVEAAYSKPLSVGEYRIAKRFLIDSLTEQLHTACCTEGGE